MNCFMLFFQETMACLSIPTGRIGTNGVSITIDVIMYLNRKQSVLTKKLNHIIINL